VFYERENQKTHTNENHRKQCRATGARALFNACASGEDQLSVAYA